jgi:osmotically-inducible protein OsmY
MKQSTSLSLLALTLLVGSPAVFTGCAATATKESTGEYVDDSAVTTKVKAAFAKDEAVKATEVKVETFKGVVQLSGFVSTAAEKARAETLAAGVDGVKSVQNKITVK